MPFVMQPDMVYQYPLWAVGFLLVGLAALGAVLFELVVHQFLSIELRRRHNDVAAAIFSVVGVTFAVLLAFVAMLAWDGFNKAKATAYAEAATVLDVYNVAVGLAGPETAAMRDDIVSYLETVIRVEWPAQAEGLVADRGNAYLQKLNALANSLKPSSVADGNLHAQLLQSLVRLSDARQQRLLAAETTIPSVVWIVIDPRRWPDDCFRLFSRRSKSWYASCHVGSTGDFRSAGADPDHCAQQPVPWRFPGVDIAV